ncbi:bifunctional 2-polyprenyl-6-hydroxyphenol methylase/3-demethylubiquinol 3-O-methyltransferase UbiG [uncultured Alsobacter sp.]|uniref:class I SAM-dependent methyltransferase n=1 Tax=uncultured Alsobacter sp. TaxID=1748258 RepID=UPI0025F19BBF|nr:class I SAM-dependent methyltransferase [uncultured Alsobacter sp.]
MSKSEHSETFLQMPQIHAEWEDDYLNPAMDALYDDAIALIAKHLSMPPGTRLLDAGCGYAYHALRLAAHGFDVTGVDFSDVALEHARQRIAASKGMSVSVQKANLLELPFPDSAFPVVFSWGVLMHVPELDKSLSELSRVVEPGGYLVLSENSCESFDVKVVEPLIRAAKAILGRRRNTRNWSERGVEEWFPSDGQTDDGAGLLVRKSNFAYFDRFLEKRGFHRAAAFSEQWTELYTRVPTQWGKRLVYTLNHRIMMRDRLSPFALGNILIYRKAPSAAAGT